MGKIYRLDLWRFGSFTIKEFEVVKRTSKTVVIIVDYGSGDCVESRYKLKSSDYAFFDTLEEANLAAENIIVNRLRYYQKQAEELQTRLQEVCRHKAITGPSDGRCVRCNFKVPNPDDYCNGG